MDICIYIYCERARYFIIIASTAVTHTVLRLRGTRTTYSTVSVFFVANGRNREGGYGCRTGGTINVSPVEPRFRSIGNNALPTYTVTEKR